MDATPNSPVLHTALKRLVALLEAPEINDPLWHAARDSAAQEVVYQLVDVRGIWSPRLTPLVDEARAARAALQVAIDTKGRDSASAEFDAWFTAAGALALVAIRGAR